MANHNVRVPVRSRIGPQRPKNADENAMSRHLRQTSGIAAAGASKATYTAGLAKPGPQRPALGEVTTTAVNRKEINKAAGKENQLVEPSSLKRGRSASLASATGAQRVPVGPGRALPTVTAAAPQQARQRGPQRPQGRAVHRVPVPSERELLAEAEEVDELDDDSMDIEELPGVTPLTVEEASAIVGEQEVEEMVQLGAVDVEEENIAEDMSEPKAPRVWPEVSTDRAQRYQREIDDVKEIFEDPVDEFDMTMVSEYSEDIFEYMVELEEDVMPRHDYMDGQAEITWDMRQTLVDWLLQVHLRYHMLPETLWIAINIIDRFLSKRVVSVVKLQLVGVTAMFIAAKYEEILAPSVDEFVFMTENGYTRDEILKGERIILQTLDFKISHYCSPYSWMRKISKADDYEIQTRTLSKFLIEVTLLDYRFLRVKPSLVAAVGMYTARRMLGGDWNDAFVFYSGFTEEHLLPGHIWLLEKMAERAFQKQHVFQKYANKKFMKASLYAVDWTLQHIEQEIANTEKMVE